MQHGDVVEAPGCIDVGLPERLLSNGQCPTVEPAGLVEPSLEQAQPAKMAESLRYLQVVFAQLVRRMMRESSSSGPAFAGKPRLPYTRPIVSNNLAWTNG